MFFSLFWATADFRKQQLISGDKNSLEKQIYSRG